MEKFVVLEKQVGETPLSCAEAYRAKHSELTGIPMAYAGRLDPMASGKLLVLFGDECKVQEKYHGLDKEYEFSVLFGIGSDTHDVLGRLTVCEDSGDQPSDCVRLGLAAWSAQSEGSVAAKPSKESIGSLCNSIIGSIELPYPHFSAKTVKNKPLHMWTLEGRLNEIEIPTNRTTVYELELTKVETKSREQVASEARIKIDTIPPVTDERKALGNDFRRVDVRKDWAEISSGNFGPVHLPDSYTIAHFRCVASSGTYMRSLAHFISKQLGTCGLAWHIHRTKIGVYTQTIKTWCKEF